MDLGFHLANFTQQDTPPAQLAQTIARLAQTAEQGGAKRISVMDHVWQVSMYGPVENAMLEAYTLLGFLAGRTESVLLHTLVTGVTYRSPGLLAKQVATLDTLSNGRAGLGIGAAWNEDEASGLGLHLPPLKERFERLEETVQICLQMWGEVDGPYDGQHYQLTRTLSAPAPLSRPRPYLLIGGGGERKTLRLVAQYADACNLRVADDTLHKLEVLQRHCDDVGRDFATVQKTTTMSITPTTSRDELLGTMEDAHELGFSVLYLAAATPRPFEALDLLASVSDDAAALS
ncbi:LLM class F420-dependent oxidoreductase [Agreia sp. Leaf283]|uniref:LLM class F420-dependent oxidoreductase n=1 Tax=Agreia sp. Leaf283 TaxID=1736321 RepID=UPI000700F123|nr:LLM class F420-dependent oxidoreductase [Agreia sp. Leaf283]KQP53958.1 LLM class F420-dependent oxidoreductase [Agreia sp. Leaf283]